MTCASCSQVKADRSNKKLYTLQQASRHVNDMAAVVVTSTKQGQEQISDHGLPSALSKHVARLTVSVSLLVL